MSHSNDLMGSRLSSKFLFGTMVAACFSGGTLAAEPIVAQNPALSETRVAFTMGGEIWLADRQGGAAHRITSGAGAPLSGGNAFSPDGSMLAYTATYSGDPDVYVLNLTGGTPRRLTFDPKPDEVTGWSADGKRVIFRSTRDSFYADYGLPRLYEVGVGAGPPRALPFPVAYNASFAPGGDRAAVEPQQLINTSWKQYRGGDQRQIDIVDIDTLAQRTLPGRSANDHSPMWIGDMLYFLSDRDGRTSLYAYDQVDESITRLFDPGNRDIKAASAGPRGIILSQIDGLSIYDLELGDVRRLDITPIGDLPGAAPVAVKLGEQVSDAAVSNLGEAVFAARGRIVYADNQGKITAFGASDHAEVEPAFIAPGLVSIFSDSSGRYELMTRDIEQHTVTNSIGLDGPGYYYNPVWSPDGTRVAFRDGLHNIWIAQPEGATEIVDGEARAIPWNDWDAVWSANGSELAYSRTISSGLSAVFIWSAKSESIHQVSSSDVDAQHPAWDADGERLWYTASLSTPPAHGYLDLSNSMRPSASRAVMVTRRQAAGWSRSLRVDIPERRYEGLFATGEPGQLLLLETNPADGPNKYMSPPTQTIHSADTEKLSTVPIIEGISALPLGQFHGRTFSTVRISQNRQHVLYQKAGQWFVATISNGEVAAQRPLPLDALSVTADPRAEWRQIFDEAFRNLEYFFHDAARPRPNFQEWKKLYEPLLPFVASRQDLSYLLNDVLGELHLSHAGVIPPPRVGADPLPPTGSLAVDVVAKADRYIIERIYHSALNVSGARAPLDEPSLAAAPGDTIDSINGEPVTTDRSLAQYLLGTAGRSIRICLSKGDRHASRCADVEPIGNDAPLRFAAWLQERRALVDKLSDGRVGYIHVPNTVEDGLVAFNAARYGQHEKEAFVLDARFTSGGFAADYFGELLTAPLLAHWQLPEGRTSTTPAALLDGPKAMVTNGYCGSGCDTYVWIFSELKIGPIIGTPTWGGVAGSGPLPTTMDGGYVTIPQYSMMDANGEFALEGNPPRPTIPLEYDFQSMVAGRDPQLERAVEELLKDVAETKQ